MVQRPVEDGTEHRVQVAQQQAVAEDRGRQGHLQLGAELAEGVGQPQEGEHHRHPQQGVGQPPPAAQRAGRRLDVLVLGAVGLLKAAASLQQNSLVGDGFWIKKNKFFKYSNAAAFAGDPFLSPTFF